MRGFLELMVASILYMNNDHWSVQLMTSCPSKLLCFKREGYLLSIKDISKLCVVEMSLGFPDVVPEECTMMTAFPASTAGRWDITSPAPVNP